ncbi:MAG: hypothetical protein ACLPOO_05255 [Terriglobales bacterium]|jgi:hypothetical protein
MAASQVVLYFEKQEDALLFALAASSAMSAEGPTPAKEAGVRIVSEISKASRITTEGALNGGSAEDEDRRKQPRHKVA